MIELIAQTVEAAQAIEKVAATSEMNSIVQMLNVCALAVMAAAFLYVVIWEQPRQRRESEADRKAEREAFQKILENERTACAAATEKQREHSRTLAREGFAMMGKVGEAITELRVEIERQSKG